MQREVGTWHLPQKIPLINKENLAWLDFTKGVGTIY